LNWEDFGRLGRRQVRNWIFILRFQRVGVDLDLFDDEGTGLLVNKGNCRLRNL